MSDLNLSDIIAAIGGNGNMLGGGNLIVLILIFLLMGNGGWGRNDYGQYASAASQQEILFGQRFQNLDNKLDRLGNGTADATYAVTQQVTTEGRAIQGQAAAAELSHQKAIDNVRLEMANYNAGVMAAIGADGEKTRALIREDKIAALTEKVRSMELQAAMCGVVRYPNQMAYNAGTSPFCNCGNGCCN